MWEILGAVASGIGNYFAADAQRDAANKAAQAQTEALNQARAFQQQALDRGMNFQQSQYNQGLGFQQGQQNLGLSLGGQQQNALQAAFNPYLQAGQRALGGLEDFARVGLGGYQTGLQGQQALTGLMGRDAQAEAIAALSGGPQMQALTQQGEEAILQNASATGGLRGGNVQAALAQFRPQMLSNLINQQYTQLGGIGALGAQGAQMYGELGRMGLTGASNQAAGGLDNLRAQLGLIGQTSTNATSLSNNYAGNVAGLLGDNSKLMLDLYGQQGAIGSGNAIAQGQADARMWQALGGIPNQALMLSKLTGNQGWGGLGSVQTPPVNPLAASLPYSPGNYTLGAGTTGMLPASLPYSPYIPGSYTNGGRV